MEAKQKRDSGQQRFFCTASIGLAGLDALPESQSFRAALCRWAYWERAGYSTAKRRQHPTDTWRAYNLRVRACSSGRSTLRATRTPRSGRWLRRAPARLLGLENGRVLSPFKKAYLGDPGLYLASR
jgi:hypothetical protein